MCIYGKKVSDQLQLQDTDYNSESKAGDCDTAKEYNHSPINKIDNYVQLQVSVPILR